MRSGNFISDDQTSDLRKPAHQRPKGLPQPGKKKHRRDGKARGPKGPQRLGPSGKPRSHLYRGRDCPLPDCHLTGRHRHHRATVVSAGELIQLSSRSYRQASGGGTR